MLRYGISKTFDVPIEYAYVWLTDFRDDDPLILSGHFSRHILRKKKGEVVWIHHYKKDGVEKEGVRTVTLKPPNSWRNEALNDDKETVFDYRLTAAGKNKTKLTIIARATYKTAESEVKSELEGNFDADWDKYKAALERAYSSGRPASA